VSSPPASLSPSLASLHQAAEASLLANVVELGGRYGLTAGVNQFRSLWTRDFCFAARGLLRIGRSDVVRDHLQLLLDHRRHDGLLPRTLDSSDAKLRVAWASARRYLPFLPAPALTEALVPEYLDQHAQETVDGAALAVLAADALRAEDPGWWAGRSSAFDQALGHTRRRARAGLIQQPPFSDWQDSVRRKGATFYTNLLVWAAEVALRGEESTALRATRARIEEAFRAQGEVLYRSVAGREFVSLDGNLLAIELGFLPAQSERAVELWAQLVRSPFWTRDGVPGFNTFPSYPVSWRNPGVILAGLGHYHDRIRWSWLTALAAKVAVRMGDLERAARALEHLATCAARDGAVSEIYSSRPPHLPWRSLVYRSEAPFAWGAGVTLDALHSFAEVSYDDSAQRTVGGCVERRSRTQSGPPGSKARGETW
jgi:hypothetical protein